MTARRWMLAGLVGAALLAVLLATAPGGVRLGLAVVGCLLLPGLGWARKMHYGDLGDTVAIAVVLSICSTVAVGTAMALSKTWSPELGVTVLALITGVGFLPTRALVDRVARTVRRTPLVPDDGGAWFDWAAQGEQPTRRRRREAAAAMATDAWGDWYADVERRAAEEKALREAAVDQAHAEWAAWAEQTQGRPTPDR